MFLAMGYSEKVFWKLTPAKFYIYRAAYQKRINERYEHDMSVGYVSASLVMAAERPSFDEIMGREKRDLYDMSDQDNMTDEELNQRLIEAMNREADEFNRGG